MPEVTACGENTVYIPSHEPSGDCDLDEKVITQNGTYNATDDMVDGYSSVDVNVPNSYSLADEGKVVSNGTLTEQTTQTITENGTYDTTLVSSLTADIDSGYPEPTGTVNITQNGTANVKDYASANVNVPNTYAAGDEGKVVSNGALVAQGSQTITQNGTYDTTLISEVTVNAPSGSDSLPSDYQRAEYIQVSASAISLCYVPYIPKTDDVIAFDVQADDYRSLVSFGGIFRNIASPSSGANSQRTAFGCEQNKKRFFSAYYIAYAADDSSVSSQGSPALFDNLTNGQRFTLAVRQTENYVPSTPESSSVSISNLDPRLHVGAYYANSGGFYSGKIYACSVTRANGIKCIDLVPVRRKSDSVAGFFDLRNGVFYAASVGTFTAGPDVN